jgi:hypothetical protein
MLPLLFNFLCQSLVIFLRQLKIAQTKWTVYCFERIQQRKASSNEVVENGGSSKPRRGSSLITSLWQAFIVD